MMKADEKEFFLAKEQPHLYIAAKISHNEDREQDRKPC